MSNWVILNEGTAQESLENPSTGHVYNREIKGDTTALEPEYIWALREEHGRYFIEAYSEENYQQIKNNLLGRDGASNRNGNMDDLAAKLVGMLEQNQSQNNEHPTLRDMFAMSALPAIYSDFAHHGATDYIDGNTEIAKEAYKMADVMLREREK